ncbi:MAG: 3D domain-containing protein [Pyrinomonadaceae bacterium]
MKKSTFLGSAVSVLLVFCVFAYPRTLAPQQNPKPNQQVAQMPAQTSAETVATNETAAPSAAAERPREVNPIATLALEKKAALSETYTATAYCLHGRTATGVTVARGMIAADPRVLPLGSRVRIEAGSYSGEYTVTDTGGAVKGHRIDIWTPTARDAMRFGRRPVKLTVLELGGKRRKTATTRLRTVTSSAALETTRQK